MIDKSQMCEKDFKRLNELLKEEDGTQTKLETINVECKSNHENVMVRGSNHICIDCGMILNKNYTFEKEWRYYGYTDTKHSNDPNRCNIRKLDEKSIRKDVDKYGISPKIVNVANDIYEKVTNNKIFRGNTRKGIIFACIYHAYSLQNNPQSCAHLIKIFEINQKVALKGLKFVNLNSPLDSKIHTKETINTKHLIQEILKEFNANETQIKEAYDLYELIENRSSLLNRSRPQSVASGVVQYYISQKNPEFSMDYFRKKVKLSELTLTRITKEIETILKS